MPWNRGIGPVSDIQKAMQPSEHLPKHNNNSDNAAELKLLNFNICFQAQPVEIKLILNT